MLMPNIKIIFADFSSIRNQLHITTGYCHFEMVIFAGESKYIAIVYLQGVLCSVHGFLKVHLAIFV